MSSLSPIAVDGSQLTMTRHERTASPRGRSTRKTLEHAAQRDAERQQSARDNDALNSLAAGGGGSAAAAAAAALDKRSTRSRVLREVERLSESGLEATGSAAPRRRLEARTATGMTPLMIAAQEGHVELVSMLLRLDADTAATRKGGLTALHLATMATVVQPEATKLQVVRLLMAAGADPAVQSDNGSTALTFAEKNKFLAVAEELRARGGER